MTRGWTRSDGAALLALATLWLFMAWAAQPSGDFPVGDDWAYATPVANLLRHHRLTVHPFTPAVSFSHVVLGALASAVFGFSFETLRLAMYVVGLIGVLGTYVLVRLLVPSVLLAAIAALTVATDPIYFLLAGSFMTDVSFYAMAVVALAGLVRAQQTDSRAAFWIGTAASCAALLNRQIGLAIPLAFALVEIVLRRPLRPWRALAPLLLGVGALGVWQLTVPATDGPSLFANVKMSEAAGFFSGSTGTVAARLAGNVLIWALYAGLLALPLVLVVRARAAASGSRIAATSAVLLVLWIALIGRAMPILRPVGNYLHVSGIGPLTLRDTSILGLASVPQLPWLGCLALSAATLFGAAWLLNLGLALGRRLVAAPRHPDAPALAMLVVVGALWTASSLASFVFDRYLLPFLAIVLTLTATVAARDAIVLRRAALWQGGVALALQMLVAVAGAHDYFAWHRAQGDALGWLLDDQRVDIATVDAGFEWSGWYLFDPDYQRPPDKSWWWVRDDTWVLAMGDIPGRTEVRRWSYRRWLPPWDLGRVAVLRVTAADDPLR